MLNKNGLEEVLRSGMAPADEVASAGTVAGGRSALGSSSRKVGMSAGTMAPKLPFCECSAVRLPMRTFGSPR